MEFRRLFITSARQCVKCKNMTHGDNIPAMGVPVMPQYINQLPLLTLIIIPLCSALYGIRKINLKSVIHFQQGTQSSSAWRVAVAMNVFSIPSFTIWCLFIRGLSALFFQGGALLATAMTLLSVSNILHYIPSPSIFVYPQQRYQSKTLRFWLSLLQSFSTLLYALLILLHSSSFIASVTNNSVYLVIPLIAYFSVFTVVFSGHSSIMNMSLLINIMCWLSGFGLLLYFGIEEASSFRTFVPSGFSLSDSLISLAVGFLVSIYQLTASPLMYQIYFPLPTVHKLRLSFILHGVFQLFTAILVFIIVSLFVAFLEKHCNLQYSYSSFFQFTKFILPHTLESYIVVASFLSVVLFSFQWLLFSLSSHLWEEFIKDHFKDWSPIKQLCSFQVVLFLLATLLVTLTTIIRFLRLPFEDITTTAVLALFTFFATVSAVFLCGYLLPFCNSRGALCSLSLTILMASGLFYLFVSHNSLPSFKNACSPDTIANTTIVIRSFNMERILLVASFLPVYIHPLIAFLVCTSICILVSMFTGGQDQMVLDWNLVICSCSFSFKRKSNHTKRPFIESESFRYAQQTGEPDISKLYL